MDAPSLIHQLEYAEAAKSTCKYSLEAIIEQAIDGR